MRGDGVGGPVLFGVGDAEIGVSLCKIVLELDSRLIGINGFRQFFLGQQ